MSTLLALHQAGMDSGVYQAAHQMLDSVASIKDPKPKPPPGVKGEANKLLGYVKWVAVFVIIGSGFVGAAALAGGHFLSHQRSSQAGIRILVGAVAAAIVFAAVYTFITKITG